MVTDTQSRVKVGPFVFVSVCICKGRYYDDKWAIPGGTIMTSLQLSRLADRNRWDMEVIK